jgi:hypothetical protein
MATVSANDLMLVFASTREGGLGDWDLWIATRSDAEASFDKPVNLGAEVNSAGFEGRPHLTSDGSTLLFMSDRLGGEGAIDLWQVTIACGDRAAAADLGTTRGNKGGPSLRVGDLVGLNDIGPWRPSTTGRRATNS